MAFVVYTAVDDLADLANTNWRVGDNDSYENTKLVAGGLVCDIKLIGRQAKDGTVQPAYAQFTYGEWRVVSSYHFKIATYFLQKLSGLGKSEDDILRPFIDSIEDQKVAHAVYYLIAAECGIDTAYASGNKVHVAALTVIAALAALGVPRGDWLFEPMVAEFDRCREVDLHLSQQTQCALRVRQ